MVFKLQFTVSAAFKSILYVAVCWHIPYCAILPAILSLSWAKGTTDGGRASIGGSTYEKRERERARVREREKERGVFPALRSRLLHSARRSAEPRAIRLAHFSLQSRFYSSSTTVLFDNCHHDESIWTLHRQTPHHHLPRAALEFLNTDPADSPVKVSSQGLHFTVYPSLSTIPPSVFSISPAWISLVSFSVSFNTSL